MIRRFGARVLLLAALLGSLVYNVLANPTAGIAAPIVDQLERPHA